MQEGNFPEIDAFGKRLSLLLDCPVRYAANGKNMFECRHDIPFPLFRLKGSTNWSWAKELHNTGVRNAKR